MPLRQNAITSIGASTAFHVALFLLLFMLASVYFASVTNQQGHSSIQLVAQLASTERSANKSPLEWQMDFEPAPSEPRPPEPEVAPAVDILQRRPPEWIAAAVQRPLPPLPSRPPVDQGTSSPTATRLAQQPRTGTTLPQLLTKADVNAELIQALITVAAPMAIASHGAQVDELPREAPLNPDPQYPAASLAARHQGTVMLRVRTTAEGRVASVEIAESSGYSLLDQAARTAVLGWRFLPARRNGEAVAFEFQMPIRFRIRS